MEYSDNVSQDVAEMREESNLKWQPLSSIWHRNDLEILMKEIMDFEHRAVSVSDLVTFNVQLMRIGRKLDLTGSANTLGTLRHLHGLVSSALSLHDEGATIHAIEGCGKDRMQIMGDLDLLYTKDNIHYACDYTNVPSPRTGVFKVNRKASSLVQSKYDKLESMYPEYSPMVLCDGSTPHLDMTIEPDIFKGSPREDDFRAVDNISRHVRQMTIQQANESLSAYASRIESEKIDKRDMVYCARNMPTEDIYMMVRSNGGKIADAYTKFRAKLSDQLMDSSLSGAQFESWQDKKVNTSFKLPLYDRSCQDRDPFHRIVAIETALEENCMTCHPLIKALSSLNRCDKVEFSMMDTMCSVERVKKDEESFNAVWLTMCNKTLIDFRDYQKEHTKTPQFSTSFSGMERDLAGYDKDWMSKGNGGLDLEIVESYIQTVMPDGKLSDDVRALMTAQLKTVSGTKMMSWVSQQQELSRALLSVPRKSQSIKGNKGSVHKNRIMLSLDTISDRLAVSLTSMGPATFSSESLWSYFIVGKSSTPSMCINDYQGVSRFLSCGQAQLDWMSTMLMKSLSYYTLLTEQMVARHGGKANISTERSFPLMLMVQNDNKFAQASEMVRYIFVNGTGWSSRPKTLLDKIAWYSPTTFTQKLYVLRMCKMMDVLQAFKSNNVLDNLRVLQKSTVPTKEGGYMERVSEGWQVALPHEFRASESDHATFNGFYICRAMTLQRYNKMVSESLVLEKQLDSREKYLAVKAENKNHELRFYNDCETLEDFLDELMNFHNQEPGPWSADWRVQTLSILATASRLSKDQSKTVGQVFDQSHNLEGVMRTLKISEVMNSRGSVRTVNSSGLLKTQVINEGKRKKTINQNGKCWKTLLEALMMMKNGVRPPKADYYKIAENEIDDIPLNLEELKGMNDKLWPLILWSSDNHAFCLSKMVHKDQIGSREIAVLNAWARIMCFYVECLARTIRDSEHMSGLNTNLIERRDKESHIENMLSRGTAEKKLGRIVFYDSADCSTWGPSMMPSNMYLTLSCRMGTSTHLGVLRNCLSLFGTKLFKIPDSFYLNKTCLNLTSNSKVDDVLKRLLSMPEDLGSYENQYIRLEESMHQGILGCTSSVLGADAHNLSNWVLEHMFRERSFKAQTFLTSDDYVRKLSWDASSGTNRTVKEGLSVHNSIMLACGIKRNLQKSALSSHYLEFNSVFHTFSGDFRPDIKQRLSFIDYGHHLDPQGNSEEVMNQAIEYLRMDGGIIGTCWIAALNNILCLFQNQTLSLYNTLGNGIHHTPLELGGLIKIDPLIWMSSTKLLAQIRNYTHTGKAEKAFSVMMRHLPASAKGVQAYLTDDSLKVSSCSRSGIMRLSTKPKRGTRDIREFLIEQGPGFFRSVLNGNEHDDLVMALISCAHREIVTESTLGPAMRLANCMHVSNQKIFKSNCEIYGDSLYSRDDLNSLAIRHASDEIECLERDPPFSPSVLNNQLEDVTYLYKHWHLVEMVWFPRKVHKEPVRIQLSSSYFVESELEHFDSLYNPLFNDEITPWDFLEAKQMLRQKLRKMVHVRYNMLMALMEGDDLGTSLYRRVCLSNFMAGCRARFEGIEARHEAKSWDLELSVSMNALKECDHSESGATVSFGSPRYSALMRTGRVSQTDITALLNNLSGDSDFNFTNTALKNQLVTVLHEKMIEEPGCFVVNTNRLSGKFDPIEHASSNVVRIHQRPLVSKDARVVGREFIKKVNNNWIHNCVLLTGDFPIPDDTTTDTYKVLDLSDETMIQVTALDEFGYFMIATNSGQYIQIVHQSLVKPSPIILWMNKSLMDSLDELESQGVYDTRKVPSISYREVFVEASGYFPTVEEEQSAQTGLLDIDEVLDEMDSDVDIDISVDDEIMDLLDEMDDEPDILKMDYEQVQEDVSDEAEELYEDASQLRPMSESRVSDPLWSSTRDVHLSKVFDVTDEYKEDMDANWRDRFYQMDLPVKLSGEYFKDDDSGSALCKLIQAIEELDEVESMWVRDYVITSLSNAAEVRVAYLKREAKPASVKKPMKKGRKISFK